MFHPAVALVVASALLSTTATGAEDDASGKVFVHVQAHGSQKDVDRYQQAFERLLQEITSRPSYFGPEAIKAGRVTQISQGAETADLWKDMLPEAKTRQLLEQLGADYSIEVFLIPSVGIKIDLKTNAQESIKVIFSAYGGGLVPYPKKVDAIPADFTPFLEKTLQHANPAELSFQQIYRGSKAHRSKKQSKKSGTQRAIIVGINDYKGTQKTLLNAVNDAEVFRKKLIRYFGFERQNVQLLTDAKATYAAFENAIDKAIAKHSGNDTLIIYFAGHGKAEAPIPQYTDPEPYWFFYPTVENGEKKSSKPVTEILFSLRLKEGRFLVIADACFAGTKLPDIPTDGKKRFLASGADHPVSDGNPAERHSIFAKHLLIKLQNAANDGQELYTDELAEDLAPLVRDEAKKLNQKQKVIYKTFHSELRDKTLPDTHVVFVPLQSEEN